MQRACGDFVEKIFLGDPAQRGQHRPPLRSTRRARAWARHEQECPTEGALGDSSSRSCRAVAGLAHRGSEASDVAELRGRELERARGLLKISVGVGDAVRIGEFLGYESGSGEAASVVVGVGTRQLPSEHFVGVRAHIEDEREQRVAGGSPVEVV
jgi:hypothetical protein